MAIWYMKLLEEQNGMISIPNQFPKDKYELFIRSIM